MSVDLRTSTHSSPSSSCHAQVASACGPGKSAEQCECLYKQHATFLSLAHSTALAAAFVAMVQVGLGQHEGQVCVRARYQCVPLHGS